jgi:hypothetical protein
MRARLSALQAQAQEQTSTIQRLRAEMAAANEKLARQAAHFMDEMRRLGAGTLPASGPARREAYDAKQKRSLVERINAPRQARTLRPGGAGAKGGPAARHGTAEDPARVNGFLRALDGAPEGDPTTDKESDQSPAAKASPAGAQPVPAGVTEAQAESEQGTKPERRAGLLERITRIDKPAASSGG